MFSFHALPIQGIVLVEPHVYPDGRGYFMEVYKESEFRAQGITLPFVQDNHSKSTYGVLRGLHFQKEPHAQGKLVRVIEGSIWDAAVDLRPGSSTYLNWYGIELSSENRLMLYIPPGFAHGFVTLSETAQFLYKCTAEYNKESESGIRWDDRDIGIDWPIAGTIVSDRDASLPYLRELI